MADQDSTPLSDQERAELEALRAEKAAREEAERARRERAELEALRAEAKAAEKPASPAAPASAARPPKTDPEKLTFGQRMVMTPDDTDDDGIPKMPPAQKLIILIGLVCFVGGGIFIWLSNAGLI